MSIPFLRHCGYAGPIIVVSGQVDRLRRAMLVKAGLNARGFATGGLRRPLLEASAEQAAAFVALLDAAGL